MATKPSGKKAKRSCRQSQEVDNRGIERKLYMISCVSIPVQVLLALMALVVAWLAYSNPPEQKPVIIILEPTVQMPAAKSKVQKHSIPKPKAQEPCIGFELSEKVAR
jgi:hypothetical protein